MSKQCKENQYVRKMFISKRSKRPRNTYKYSQGCTPQSRGGRARYGMPNHNANEKRNRRIG